MLTKAKIQSTLLFLMLLVFVVVFLSKNAFAQTLNDRTLEVITKQPLELDTNAHIDVGKYPIDIAINENFVYIVNRDSHSVSVISAENKTKIKDIPVGKIPTAIAIDDITHTVYVVNFDSDSISVISAENNTKIKDIPVGDSPIEIALDHNPLAPRHIVYVVNRDSNSISVINGTINELIKNIPVGDWPTSIAISGSIYVTNFLSDSISVVTTQFSEFNHKRDIPVGKTPTAIAIDDITQTVYVANAGSDSVSVIDGISDKVVAGITFEVTLLIQVILNATL